jgi:hypothetical protein
MIKFDAIRAVYPFVVFGRGDEVFDAEGNPVSYDEAAVQAYIDAHAYIAQRQQAYPSIPEQLDLIYHQGLDAWKSAIQAVKDQYPKG